MKKFIKKVLYFDIIYNLTNIFFSNMFFFENGKTFQVVMDTWTLIFFVGWFFYGIVGIGIIKYLSLKINKFIYESDALICYLALNFRGLTWLNVLFFGFLDDYFWGIIGFSIEIICFVLLILILFHFWKYRIEISAGIFLTAFIYAFTHWEKPFYSFFSISNPNELLRGLFILVILVLFLPTVIFLRNKDLYDFRSRKDKRLETKGEGPYQK